MAAVAWLAVWPPAANAQGLFLEAVRELAATGSSASADFGNLLSRRTAALARMKVALAEWDGNIKTLETRIAPQLRDASNERAFQLRVELGLAYRQRGRLENALRQFDDAAAAQPGASDVHVLRALTLSAAGNGREAGRAFRLAWLHDTTNPVKAYLALTTAGDLNVAERERARKALQGAFERVLTRDTLAREAPFLVQDPVPDTLSRTPIVADATMGGVFARLAQGKLDDAVTAFDGRAQTVREDDSPLAHFERGRADETRGRHAEARRAYTAALEGTLAGRHVLHVAVGRLAHVEGDVDAAIDAFGHAVRLNPNDSLLHRELAGAYAAAGRIDEAFAELVAALLIDPRDADAMAAAGQLFLDHDRAADAVRVLRRAIEVNPDRVSAHYALAMALSRSGRAEEAARQFERFERLSGQALEHRRREASGQAGADDVRR